LIHNPVLSRASIRRGRAPRRCASAATGGERQANMNLQPVRRPVLGKNRAAHRLDIAARDPQPDAEIAARRFTSGVVAPFGIIALEDALDLTLGDPGAAIGDDEVGEAAIMRQMNQHVAAGR